MNIKSYKKPSRTPSHAGQILKSGFIDEYGLRIETVAELLGITRVHLSRIINGHNAVTPDIAIRLEALTQTPASQWLAIQAKYDTYMLEQQQGFQMYVKSLAKWTANSLPMKPDERRHDEATRELVAQVAGFAKQLSNRKEVSG